MNLQVDDIAWVWVNSTVSKHVRDIKVVVASSSQQKISVKPLDIAPKNFWPFLKIKNIPTQQNMKTTK